MSLGQERMAGFGGFQDSVKRVMTARTLGKKNEHVLYPSRSRSCIRRVSIVGAEPISQETATELRMVVFGAADIQPFSLGEWLQHPFSFYDAGTAQAYGLRVPNCSTKGLLMCVQAYVLKHLLFSSRKLGAVADIPKLLRTTRAAQVEALIGALSDVLWTAGGRQQAVLCLAHGDANTSDDPQYMDDGCTEKVVTFNLGSYEEVKFTVKKYLFEMVTDGHHGILLFLYSVILSRTFPSLREDLDGLDQPLIQTNGAIHPCLATLLLTGRATPYLHNGIVYEGSEDTMARAKTGILQRAEVGLLVWKRQDGDKGTAGSRLKTPSLPIWVTRCNDSYGILFNPNRDLIRDYHAENRFDLYYYSSNSSQSVTTILTIDTRSPSFREEYQLSPLENLIHTKWMDAEVNWNGTAPYV
ncbi:inactive ubiquitin carboxyl-terminal hydrolase MINDY-4B-like isoform X2 [Eriocheir sinensis]|uniref:inactive ubiquitin carboxyl-terminal hydrolase MINDY-4B-like isoform X2 n=1 Tax=Eriocheir sinensis TaxID=95602 RepID=UPI0021C734C1|nr:inactive ubiquitin carboxyl-terminal hydrolase MINDY-4B-like isoform X2 [Eriocheir sinensis]